MVEGEWATPMGQAASLVGRAAHYGARWAPPSGGEAWAPSWVDFHRCHG